MTCLELVRTAYKGTGIFFFSKIAITFFFFYYPITVQFSLCIEHPEKWVKCEAAENWSSQFQGKKLLEEAAMFRKWFANQTYYGASETFVQKSASKFIDLLYEKRQPKHKFAASQIPFFFTTKYNFFVTKCFSCSFSGLETFLAAAPFTITSAKSL